VGARHEASALGTRSAARTRGDRPADRRRAAVRGPAARLRGVRLPFTGGEDWTLRAAFSDVGGIHGGQRTPVLVAGVPAGIVTGVRVDHGLAVVTMRMNASARGVVRGDAGAAIEPRSALEDHDDRHLAGGHPRRRRPRRARGSRSPARPRRPRSIRSPRCSTPTPGPSSRSCSTSLRAASAGVAGPLQDAVGAGCMGCSSRPAGSPPRSPRRRVLLTELVGSLAKLGASAERHDASLAQALRAGAVTLQATAARQASIESSVRELPSTVASVDGALSGIRTLAAPLVPTLARLGATAEALPGALRAGPAGDASIRAARGRGRFVCRPQRRRAPRRGRGAQRARADRAGADPRACPGRADRLRRQLPPGRHRAAGRAVQRGALDRRHERADSPRARFVRAVQPVGLRGAVGGAQARRRPSQPRRPTR